MSAYENDNSEETQKRIQELKVSISEAEQELAETEYEKFINDSEVLLSSLYDQYSEILNNRLDNIDYLLSQVIDSINLASSADGTIATALGAEGALAIAVSNNATSISGTLTSEANKVGVTLSSAMKEIWNGGDGDAKSVLTMYGEDFKTKSANILTTLNGISVSVNNMMSYLNKDAQKQTTANKTSTSAKKDPTKDNKSNTNNTNKTNNNTNKSSGGDGKPKVGDRVKFVSGQYYYDSQGKNPLGSKNRGKEVYITNVNEKSWATHPIHISTGNKLGKGDLGWLKKEQISGYASGKKNFASDEMAWTQENGQEFIVRPSDGAILTPVAKRDSILNEQASSNIWDMANSPAEFIKNNLGVNASNVPNNSSIQNHCVQNFENIVFSMPNVKNYGELLLEMQKDPKFEKLILAMTLDQVVGKSSLHKCKSIR